MPRLSIKICNRPHCWPIKQESGCVEKEHRPERDWARETAEPWPSSVLPARESQVLALRRAALFICKQRQGTQEGPPGGWECAQANVKPKPWKLSPKSKYAVTQSVHRLARAWLSYEVTRWHALRNSLACPWLISGIPSWVNTDPQPGWERTLQPLPRGLRFTWNLKPTVLFCWRHPARPFISKNGLVSISKEWLKGLRKYPGGCT